MAVSTRTGPGVLLRSGPILGGWPVGCSSLIWPHPWVWELGLGLLGGSAGVGGHLPDLPAVVVNPGPLGVSCDPGEQVGLAGQERGPLGGIDDVVDGVGGGAAAHLGQVVQEVGDVAGGDPVVGVAEVALVGLRVAGVVVEVAVLSPVAVHVVLLSRSRAVTVLACLRWLERSRKDWVPVSTMWASKVIRSTIAAQSRGSVKVRAHSENAEFEATATEVPRVR